MTSIRSTEDLAAPWLTIIGVSPPVFQQSPNQDLSVQPTVCVPFRHEPLGAFTVLARSSGSGDTVVAAIRNELRQLDVDLPLYNIRTMDDILAQRNWPYRGTLFATFAVIALLISAVGIYAVTANGVGQRTQEIGVRIALGARGRDILWLVLRHGITRICLGLVLGVLVTLLACYMPARRATRLDPVDALRTE